MISYSAAYGLRLIMWWILLVAVVGGGVYLSRFAAKSVVKGLSADDRYRLAAYHFFSLMLIPLAGVAIIHAMLGAMGSEVSRNPPTSGAMVFDTVHATTAAVIVASLWLAGFCILLVRLFIGLKNLRDLPTSPAPLGFVDEVVELAASQSIRCPIDVCVADIASPHVSGVKRMVLAVPRHFLDLPRSQRKAVLLHELAHVARRDFRTNIIQQLVLAFLWFQPIAWRLQRQLAASREACCDRLAIVNGASAPALAAALVHLTERARPPRSTAMAVLGTQSLAWRLEMLALGHGHPADRRSIRSLTLIAFGLLAIAMAVPSLASQDEGLTDLYIASRFGPTVAIAGRDPAGNFVLRVRQGRVVEAELGLEPERPAKVTQRGEQVTLSTKALGPVLNVRVKPQGRIQWTARSPRA